MESGRAAEDRRVSAETPMRWPRPRPLIGDATSSAERAGDPASWAFPEAARAVLADVIAARRDVRRFRPDPVEPGIVTEILAAGHAAPSVGHSQPWRFIVVQDAALRASAAVMADRARLAQARELDPDSARHLRSLQLDGIREAPVGIVVCCDRRARPAGVLGRATFPDADLWSCACAIENIWLTARGHGLGLGWVTLFDPAELAELLGLPDGVVTLGWLCLGWPDERPPAPGLERQGWSRRLPLSDVVAADRWPGAAPPAAPRDRMPAATAAARVGSRDGEDRLLAVPGSLGLLGDALLRAGSVQAPGRPDAASGSPGAASGSPGVASGSPGAPGGEAWPAVRPGLQTSRPGGDGPGTLLIAGADHPVAALGVSAFPASTTRLIARALAAGQGQGAAAARTAGLAVRLADCGIDGDPVEGWADLRPGGARGDLAGTDALTPGAVAGLLAAGERAGRALAAAGPVALGEVGIANTTVAAVLAAALLAVPPGRVAGRGAGSDTAIVARKEAVIGQALARMGGRVPPAGPLSRAALADLLCGLGGPEQVFLTGACLGAAAAGGLVVLDGLLTGVSALAAVRYRPEVQDHLIAGQLSAEPAHRLVLDALGLEPLLDLRLRAGEGVGAVLAVSLMAHAERARLGTATTN
jgi:nicotinate-nucleotide--dimethylbenzimidazole phosphoribosyltransferase